MHNHGYVLILIKDCLVFWYAIISVAVDCGSIQNPLSGMVDTSSGTIFMNIATYSCNRGYFLIGVATRTCNADQQWKPEAPSCDRE